MVFRTLNPKSVMHSNGKTQQIIKSPFRNLYENLSVSGSMFRLMFSWFLILTVLLSFLRCYWTRSSRFVWNFGSQNEAELLLRKTQFRICFVLYSKGRFCYVLRSSFGTLLVPFGSVLVPFGSLWTHCWFVFAYLCCPWAHLCSTWRSLFSLLGFLTSCFISMCIFEAILCKIILFWKCSLTLE